MYQVVCLKIKDRPDKRRRPMVETSYHFLGMPVTHRAALNVQKTCDHTHDFRPVRV